MKWGHIKFTNIKGLFEGKGIALRMMMNWDYVGVRELVGMVRYNTVCLRRPPQIEKHSVWGVCVYVIVYLS